MLLLKKNTLSNWGFSASSYHDDLLAIGCSRSSLGSGFLSSISLTTSTFAFNILLLVFFLQMYLSSFYDLEQLGNHQKD